MDFNHNPIFDRNLHPFFTNHGHLTICVTADYINCHISFNLNSYLLNELSFRLQYKYTNNCLCTLYFFCHLNLFYVAKFEYQALFGIQKTWIITYIFL